LKTKTNPQRSLILFYLFLQLCFFQSESSLDSLADRKKDRKSSKHKREGSADTNELSETELEKQRALLLQQLKFAGGGD